MLTSLTHTHKYSHTQCSVAYAFLESDNGEKVRRELTLAEDGPKELDEEREANELLVVAILRSTRPAETRTSPAAEPDAAVLGE